MIDFMIMNIEGTKIVKKYMTKVEPGSDLSIHIYIYITGCSESIAMLEG